MTTTLLRRVLPVAWFLVAGGVAIAQNDWQFPDPYFGALQHRTAGTPQAERRYRAEIAPQQPHRVHEHRQPPSSGSPRARWLRPRGRPRGGG